MAIWSYGIPAPGAPSQCGAGMVHLPEALPGIPSGSSYTPGTPGVIFIHPRDPWGV